MTTRVPIRYGGTGANTAAGARTALDVLPTTGGTFSGSLNVSSRLNVSSILTTNSRATFGNGFNDHANTKGINVNSIVFGGIKDENGPAEVLVVNKSNGAVAYAEFIALNDSANQEQGWISVGINSSDYNDPEFTLTGPDDGYLLFEPPEGTTANGDLIIGTGSYGQNNRIVLAAGGFEPSDAQLIIAPAELKTAEIVNSSLNNNVAILTTSTTHTFIANDIVVISSVGAPYDGTRTITGVTANTFNVSITNANVASAVVSPAGSAVESLPFNKGTVELTAQLFVGENSKQTIEDADITLAVGHAIPLGIVVDNDGPGQTVMFNKSNGALSYSEFIAHNDSGNVEHGWISIGINSSGYDDPEFPITKADDGYILFEAPENTPGDGDLIIGTGAFGAKNRLIFAAEGFDEANAQMIITPNESVRISIDTDASSSNTGALQVVGGVGVQGSMYVQGNQTIQGDLIVNGSQIIQSIENLAAAGPISLVSDGNIANTWDQGIVGTYAVSKASAVHAISFKEIANNSATISTANNHGFLAEDIVTIAGVDATFNGTHRITGVTANTLSYYLLSSPVTKTSSSGTATVDKTTRYTGVAKRASDGAWRVFSNLGTRPEFNTDFADANLVYDSIIAGAGDFRGTLKLGSPNTATITYSDANNRALTIPALGGDRTFAFIDQAQTFTAAQGFNSTVTATKFIPTAGDATGNGLYLPSANKLAFSADSVERVSMSASEMVVNDGSNDYDFRVESDGVAHMLFVDGGTNTVGIGTNAPTANLHVQGSGYISGSVGIGTTNPATTLHVDASGGGIVRVSRLGAGAGILQLEADGTDGAISSTNNTRFQTNSTERMRITTAGAVLVGITSDPTGGTTQHFFSHSSNTATAFIIGDAGNVANTSGLYIRSLDARIVRPTDSPIHIADTGGTRHLTVAGNGNIGIGSTSPAQKLDVNGAVQSTDYRVASSSVFYLTGDEFRFRTTGGTERFRIDGNGNFGFSTTPSSWSSSWRSFDIGSGSLAFTGAGSNDFTLAINAYYDSTDSRWEYKTTGDKAARYQITAAGTHAWFATNVGGTANNPITFGDAKMFIDAVGNVGIGTTNPSSPLHVVTGSADSSGFNFETTGSSGKTFFAVHKLGFIRVRSSDTNGAAIHFWDNAGTKRAELGIGSDSKINWYSDALSSIWLTFDGANGRVGIGTDSPGAKLDIYHGSNVGSGANGVRVHRPASYGQYGYLEYLISSDITVLGSVYTGGGGSVYGQIYFRQHSSTTSRDAMVINASGYVGISTTAPGSHLQIGTDASGDTTDYGIKVVRHGNGAAPGSWSTATPAITIVETSNAGPASVDTNALLLFSMGRFGTTHTNAKNASLIHVTYDSGSDSPFRLDGAGNLWVGWNRTTGITNNGTMCLLVRNGAAVGSNYQTTTPPSNGLIVEGRIGIGTTNPSRSLSVNGEMSANGTLDISGDGGQGYVASRVVLRSHDNYRGTGIFLVGETSAVSNNTFFIGTPYTSHSSGVYIRHTANNYATDFQSSAYTAAGNTLMHLSYTGAVSIPGSLSKGSGSFKIDHPLPEKSNTHHLVHSFIEGPQADLIYRGKVQLINGMAVVNIDAASGMTEGTFVALCREVQCFTTNETTWDAVRGSVSGNILTIECQNSSSNATISWMVIGERQDKHMYDTEWTDENGKVIVEPEKQIIEVVEEET